MIETIIDAVLISPHDDDVPFSLGGALLDARFDKGIIVTLFSVSKCTIDDREDDVDCVTQIRKAENQQFYCALGSKIRLINSDRLDAPLRLGIREEDVFNTELSGSEDERREAEQLRQTLELMKPKRGVLFAPLGLGEHVDHLLVNHTARVLMRDGWPTAFYEDLPYAARMAPADIGYTVAKLQDSTGVVLKPVLLRSYAEVDRKANALKVYHSQADWRTISEIVAYGKRLGHGLLAERLWCDPEALTVLGRIEC